ncbi:PRC-barrel domain-containing protein [Terrihabitans sp. B22-R8]|uniref:PRC-barrel domain-containing protein n=1 Tax=Terrihabitans sp. B22-R8 TaxID=3425128 RepID=UPI00403C9D2E
MLKQILLSGIAATAFASVAIAQAPTSSGTGATPSAGVTAPAASQTDFADLDGKDIIGDGDASIGTLDDVLLDRQGRITGLIVAQGGVLGIGATRREIPSTGLPPVQDGKVRLAGQTKDSVAALPEFKSPEPDAAEKTAMNGPAPQSGANQQAPQAADSHVPAAPNVTPDPNAPTAPLPDSSAVQNDRASGTSPLNAEESAAGSGSSGMAPQQGTGTGATQNVGDHANEQGAQPNEGNSAGDEPGLREQYGRDQQPTNQPRNEDSAARATAGSQGGDGVPAGSLLASRDESLGGRETGPASSLRPDDGTRYLAGPLIGTTVKGVDDGIKIDAIVFDADGIANVRLTPGRAGANQDSLLSFDQLNIAGTPDKPEVALNASTTGRPLTPGVAAPDEISR